MVTAIVPRFHSHSPKISQLHNDRQLPLVWGGKTGAYTNGYPLALRWNAGVHKRTGYINVCARTRPRSRPSEPRPQDRPSYDRLQSGSPRTTPVLAAPAHRPAPRAAPVHGPRHRVADGCHREREATGGRIHGPNAGCWAAPAASAVAAVAAATVAGGTAAAAAEPAVAADAYSSPVTPGRSGRAPGEATLDRRAGRRRALEPTPSPVHKEFDPTICPVRSSNVLP